MKSLLINQTEFIWGSRTYVMGILNITPDSFSGDGLISQDQIINAALKQAETFLINGADILDIGGESTRPGAALVSADEEINRVIPVIKALASQFPQAVISIDSYKAVVAEQALQNGAHLINDVWGLQADPNMKHIAAKQAVPVILMHNRSKPANAEVQQNLGGRYVGVEYANLIEDVAQELLESVALAHEVNIPDERIILDPGIGFGKTIQQNLELVDRLNEIRNLGYPVLLGTSRKSFIGYTLDLPPDQRIEGTAATVAVGITRGADIIRVHDVQAMARVAKMTDAIVRRSVA